MWQEFFRFDLRYQLRQPLLWIVAAALAAIAFLSAGSDAVRIGGAIGNVHLNAPTVIANQLGILSLIAMFMVTVFIAGAILRDGEAGIADLLFAAPVRKLDYLAGRFLAGFAACLAVFALITVAMMLGARLPSIDPQRLGAFSLQPYLWAFCVLVVPNLLFVAALLTLLAALTRSLIMVYAGVIAFTVLWGMAASLSGGGNGASLAVLLDPFGVRALAQLTRYYSAHQANTQLPPLSGVLLLNRVLWTGIALGLFGATVACFKTQHAGTAGQRFGKRTAAKVQVQTPAAARPMAPSAVRRIAPRFSAAGLLAQWRQLLRFETRGVLRGLPFLILLLLAVANFVANYTVGGMRFDSVPYPLTRLVLEELAGSMHAVLLIVLVFYSGELVFRDRQVKIADLLDAMPLPDWVPFSAKAGALFAVVFAFLGAGVLAGVAIQLVKGGAPVEAGLYLQGTLVNAVYFMLMALALLALQAVANNKYGGYLLGIGLLASGTVLKSLGLEHRLLHYADLPALTYSDINGYGHFLAGWSWFALYWTLFALALAILAQAFWTRGRSDGWRLRLRALAPRLRGKAGAGLILSLAAWAACGGWIFYNTNVVNRYASTTAALDGRADYEKQYRRYLALPNPSLTQIRADVDIYPAERRVAIRGRYVVRNKTSEPLRSLRFQLDPRAVTTPLTGLPAHTVTLDDRRLGFRIIELRAPLVPGAELAFGFTADMRNPGFTESGAPDGINHNGTMFTSEDYFPKLGYVQASEISDRAERRKRGLGEPHRIPALDDRTAHGANFWKLFGFDADLITFETTVSTGADQVAIAPGNLAASWEKDGRRYNRYTMDKPVLPFFSFQSGRWDVKKADWHGVPIEVYYDRKHPWNIDSMIKGSQGALDYFSANFGPYPHKVLRITEFPLYLPYARSLPNTIPFSESLGFVNDLRGEDKVDHVFYVTAHEVAHQWWGDQLIPANTQGMGMLVESLAEYSALMAVEKTFGTDKVRHILRWDLDQYFAGRAKELVEEQPLFKVEDQTYIQYRKGSLVFWRLREELGEDVLNRVLKDFLAQHCYQTAPYVTSRDLLAALRAAAPAAKQDLITDLFERIVFYDNRMLDAGAVRRADGKWDVTMKVRLAKLEADGKGKETARAYNEPIELAVFGRDENGKERVLWRGKRMLAAGESRVSVTVDAQPVEAGVDAYNLLIDRVAGDNRKAVSVR
jgi:ABC-2 type transport system permease protein